MRMPLVPLLAAMMTGIVTGNFIHIPNLPLAICLFIVFLLLLAARLKNMRALSIGLLMMSVFFIGIFNINLYVHTDQEPGHISHHVTGETVVVEGVISENPEASPDKTEITISTTRIIRDDAIIPVHGLVLLSITNFQSFNYGDYVRFRTRLKSPHNFNNPGGFDYVKHLRYRGIMVRGFINDPSRIVILRENQGNPIKTYIETFRGRLKKLIRDNSVSPDGEIIQAMILGNQKEIPQDVMEKFNKTGTTHIIAISGFNIGIIAALSIIVARLLMKSWTYLLLRFNIHVVTTVFAIIPVVVFTFIAGTGMSVVRAAIMAVIFMIAIIIGKERDLYNTLALAAFIILAISPHSLFDISFQLSFVAVWSILFITPRLMEWLPKISPDVESRYSIFNRKTLRNILIFISVSVSATLGTLPLIVFYFNRISSIVLLSNVLVVPVLGIIAIPVCTAIIAAALISSALAVFFLHISSFLVWISVAMVDFLASVPGSSFFVSTPTLPELALYYGLLIIGVKLLDLKIAENKKEDIKKYTPRQLFIYETAFIVLILLLFADVIYLNTRDMFAKTMKVTAIDVGQGSSTLVQLPAGRKMLIDGGGFPEGSFDVGKYVVGPFLWHERISKIDIVVLTHPHPDHLNGLLYILSNFEVGEVWTNGDNSDDDNYRDFLRIIDEKKIGHRSVSEATQTLITNNVMIDILNPAKLVESRADFSRHFEDENNRSVVMRITYGDISFLFPGDISEAAESRLIHSHREMRSQVLFIPHHGGFTSSSEAFIRRIFPEIAVVSCGFDNIYKFPHPEVLKRYSIVGTKIFRTDKNGAVNIVTDGSNVVCTPFRQGRL